MILLFSSFLLFLKFFSNSSDNNVELLAATINEHYLAILSQVTPYKTGNNFELVALDIPFKKQSSCGSPRVEWSMVNISENFFTFIIRQ